MYWFNNEQKKQKQNVNYYFGGVNVDAKATLGESGVQSLEPSNQSSEGATNACTPAGAPLPCPSCVLPPLVLAPLSYPPLLSCSPAHSPSALPVVAPHIVYCL